MSPPTSNALCIIAGVGPGTSRSLALKFSSTYPVVLLARTPANYEPIVAEIRAAGGKAVGVRCDVCDSEAVGGVVKGLQEGKVFEGGEGGGGALEVAVGIFNVGGRFVRKPFLELSEEEFGAGWEANGKGAFNFSRALLPHLLSSVPQTTTTSPQHPPTLLFTGATASVKGSSTCASFATGKFALRALAQSLAREFGPRGVHVAHVVVDGVIDIPRTKGWVFEKEDAKLGAGAVS
ncbi:hypothetical protein MMC12_001522 [Toensbergia leucococca]|nr:hypothetical protein [Toensbergia leucococca]